MKNKKRNILVVNIGMDKEQIKFIDRIAQEMRFSGGKKPSRSCILNTFIKTAMLMKLDVSGIKSEKDSEERFFRAFKIGPKNSDKK